jgi:hypothetical protein
MSIAHKTSTALRAYSTCVCPKAHGLRGRDGVNRARGLDGAASMQRMCASQGTPGLRARDDVDRAQDLDGAASINPCVCHTTHLV